MSSNHHEDEIFKAKRRPKNPIKFNIQLNEEQKAKFFSLKESLNVKSVYKLVDGEHEKIELITGLNSGGYTEIVKGDLEEGDDIISKVTVQTSSKKALRLF